MTTTRHRILRIARPAFALLAWAALTQAAVAAVPPTFRIEGLLRTTAGGPVSDGEYGMIIALYDAADAKQELYKEALVGVTVQGGHFTTAVGAFAPFDPKIFEDAQALWLGVAVGKDPEMPRVPFSNSTISPAWTLSRP